MRVLLVSTYELGHQPWHLASPAAALLGAGHDVRCLDLSVEAWEPDLAKWAEAVACSVPMHTAMRLACRVVEEVRLISPGTPVCLYGLYATSGATEGTPDRLISGEYEPDLVRWVDGLERPDLGEGAADMTVGGPAVTVALGRNRFSLPARHLLPPLHRYARLCVGEERRLAGYVEASHGCAHRCRHCPVPVVYDGRTRLVGVEAVVADVAQVVDMGARHVTFGDPDFLNGPHHSLRVVTAVHERFPELSFDCTVKVSHVLQHAKLWPELASAGCLFVVTAVESADDVLLSRLDKGHTRADVVAAVELLRRHGIEPRPSLLTFTPWTTLSDVVELLDLVAELDLVGNVDPVHYAIRLLVPEGSLLIDHPDLAGRLGPYDEEQLGHPWASSDPRVDALHAELAQLVERADADGWSHGQAYLAVRQAAVSALGTASPPAEARARRAAASETAAPRLSEAWFCCAEPTAGQLGALQAASSAAG